MVVASGACGPRGGNDAELREDRDQVDPAPVLDDLAGRWNAHEGARVGAGGREAGNDQVVLGDLVLDGELQVGKAGDERLNPLPHACSARRLPGETVVVNGVFGGDLVDDVQLLLVHHLFKEPTDQGLV